MARNPQHSRCTTRREFIRSTAMSLGPIALAGSVFSQMESGGRRPNILWLVSEDPDEYVQRAARHTASWRC